MGTAPDAPRPSGGCPLSGAARTEGRGWTQSHRMTPIFDSKNSPGAEQMNPGLFQSGEGSSPDQQKQSTGSGREQSSGAWMDSENRRDTPLPTQGGHPVPLPPQWTGVSQVPACSPNRSASRRETRDPPSKVREKALVSLPSQTGHPGLRAKENHSDGQGLRISPPPPLLSESINSSPST